MGKSKGHEPAERPYLAVRLSATRELRGYTQNQLADIAGVSRQTVIKLEKGHDAKLKTVFKLAEALDLDPRDLVAGGNSDIGPYVDRYLKSKYAEDAAPKPDADEIAWLRSLPSVIWRGIEPTEKTIDKFLDALRASRKTSKEG